MTASLAALRHAFVVSLAPKDAAEARLVDEQLRIARRGSQATTFVLPFGAVLIALAESAWVPLWRLIAWPALIAVLVIGVEIAHRTIRAHTDDSIEGITFRARAFTVMSAVQAAAWCAMAPFLWPDAASSGQTLIFLTIACTLAGWSSMGAVHYANGALSMAVYLVAIVTMPFLGGYPLGGFLSALAFAFWFLMAGLFDTNYETRTRMLKLAHERGKLIDELSDAKEESDRARERAEDASRAKSAFLANMSHELRTPLNAILGFSEIIQAGGASRRFSEYGGYIHGSGKHLLALINDILDLAKIEAGRMALHEAEMEIAPAMENARVLMSVRAEAQKLSMCVEIDPRFPALYADERAVCQVLTNLVSNAVKFTPEGGRVVLFAHLDMDGAPVFGVEDNGVGIAQSDLALVFENFGQGRHDAVIADRGTGLGLPIVRGLVEAMGGRVSLDSTPGEGTRVTITLPKSRVRERMKQAV
jgi:two-component system cell cycle sensor histidine kinase PleC